MRLADIRDDGFELKCFKPHFERHKPQCHFVRPEQMHEELSIHRIYVFIFALMFEIAFSRIPLFLDHVGVTNITLLVIETVKRI